MRHLFHLGLFLGALVAVTSAEAQPNQRADRRVTVVVAGHGHPKYHYEKRIYRLPPERGHGHYKKPANRRLHDEQRDLQQIIDISRAWRRATITRDRYGQALTDRRLEAWVARELYEARRDRYAPYERRIRELSRELDALSWRFASGRAHRYHYVRKSEILDDLVALSERQIYVGGPPHHVR
jgi:hypothetical protein